MTPFLAYVARDIVSRFGTDLTQIVVVFPNKRAALFLNDYLARATQHPIWSPHYITISELFQRHSTLELADEIALLVEVYKSFTAKTGSTETLDHFFSWGQVLLADFDDIDKNMADANKVLANLRDYHELDNSDYLNDEQKRLLRQFFSNFADDQTGALKERFLKLWSKMADIYHDFNQRLRQQGRAYEGALYRDVAERIEHLDLGQSTYLFVGFNLVQPVEQALFRRLKSDGRALFYWDYDERYLSDNHEAGLFLRRMLAEFPNALTTDDDSVYRQWDEPKTITLLSAPTENIQARYIHQWLKAEGRIEAERRTAIVLANEDILPSAIHCLPAEVDRVNITTGFPLIQTPVASFVQQMINLQTKGYSTKHKAFRLRQAGALLRHAFAALLSPDASLLLKSLTTAKNYYPTPQELALDEDLALLFCRTEGCRQLLQWMVKTIHRVALKAGGQKPEGADGNTLMQESLFRMYSLLNRLLALTEHDGLVVDTTTLSSLITQLVESTSIPFHGEPAEGLQIMGVLETRNLDYDHVLLLSCNEGKLPRGLNVASFIPHAIRRAYGLTVDEQKVAVYAYYFYRLLQRAHDITIAYNNATDKGQKGEMSRFMLQLMLEAGTNAPHVTIRKGVLGANRRNSTFRPPVIEKTPEVMRQLAKRFSVDENPDVRAPLLTPTAICRYLRCQLMFYYRYACDIKEPDIAADDDTIDNRLFGNIFHEAAQLIYEPLMRSGRPITQHDIDPILLSKTAIANAVDRAIEKELFGQRADQPHKSRQLNGLQTINRAVIIYYLKQLLTTDKRLTPFTIIALEGDISEPYSLPDNSLHTTIGGRIDRLDMVDSQKMETAVGDSQDGGERLRVIDYKTGSNMPKALPDIEAIFQPEYVSQHSDYVLQTMLYATLTRRSPHYNSHQRPVAPALLFIQHAAAEGYDPTISIGSQRVSDIRLFAEDFWNGLTDLIGRIFSPEVPFSPTTDRRQCERCPYRQICAATESEEF